MSAVGLERGFAVVVGAALIALGLLASLANPVVGRPETGALITTGAGLDLVHVVTGALFVHVGLALNGRNRANGLVVLGVVYLVLGILSLLSADLLGIYGAPISAFGQLGHVVLGVAALIVGWTARGGEVRDTRRRVSRRART